MVSTFPDSLEVANVEDVAAMSRHAHAWESVWVMLPVLPSTQGVIQGRDFGKLRRVAKALQGDFAASALDVKALKQGEGAQDGLLCVWRDPWGMGPAELQDTMQERSRIIVMALRIKPGSPPDVNYGICVA